MIHATWTAPLLREPAPLRDAGIVRSVAPAGTLPGAGYSQGHSARPDAPGVRVSVKQLSRAFGARRVLDDIDLDIAPGEFLAIVGRSGCGKSTLLRLLAGLDRPDGGQVLLDGNPADAHRGEVRLMFQEARLLPWKRVIDNIALGLPRAWGRERALEALEQVGLRDRAHDWPAALSGGQKQRVALARALVHTPRLLLLDEPLGALDALTRIEMQQLIERLWRENGFTAVLVTHDVSEAVAMADRVVVIDEHRIGLTSEIPLSRPRSRAQEGFAASEHYILTRVLGHSA